MTSRTPDNTHAVPDHENPGGHRHALAGVDTMRSPLAHQAGRLTFFGDHRARPLSSSPHRCRHRCHFESPSIRFSRCEGCHEFCVNVIHQHNLLAEPIIPSDPCSHRRWFKAGAIVRSTKRAET